LLKPTHFNAYSGAAVCAGFRRRSALPERGRGRTRAV